MTDGTTVELNLLEGGAGPLLRVTVHRPLGVLGLWPAAEGKPSTLEVEIR
jgi:hypothetical protein